MSKFVSILFLILVPLFFIGLVAGLIYNISKSKKTGNKIKTLAVSMNWQYYGNENEELKKLLNDFFQYEGTRFNRKLLSIIHGKNKNKEFWFTFYKSRNRNSTTSTNKNLVHARSLNMFIIPAKYTGKPFMLLKQNRLTKLLPYEKINKFSEKQLVQTETTELQDFLTDNLQALQNLQFTSSELKQISDAMNKADFFFIFNNYAVYAVNSKELIPKKEFMQHLEQAQKITDIIADKR